MIRFDNTHKISLKIPSYADYVEIYEERFKPEVVYWADDEPQNLTMDDYANGRMIAQTNGEIVERIILLDGIPIGTVTGRDFVDRTCQCTLGVVIVDRRNWGHGYGFEAIRLFLKVLAAEGIGLVILETYANNKRAQHCFFKLGFQKRRAYFAPCSGRFVVQMFRRLPPLRVIGETISRDDPRWKPPRK